jgi:hypothetical protein
MLTVVDATSRAFIDSSGEKTLTKKQDECEVENAGLVSQPITQDLIAQQNLTDDE